VSLCHVIMMMRMTLAIVTNINRTAHTRTGTGIKYIKLYLYEAVSSIAV